MKLRVIDPLGQSVCGYGTRREGETFDDMPQELMQELATQYPDRFELVEESAPPTEESEV